MTEKISIFKLNNVLAPVQCNPPNSKGRMYFTQSDIGKVEFNPEDLRFLRDQVSFNLDLVNRKQFRLPAYLYCRFVNHEDFIAIEETSNFFCPVEGYKSKSKEFPTLPPDITEISRERLGVKDHHYCSKLESCTPWLSKGFPQSVRRNIKTSQNNKSLEDKIYAAIEVDYKDDYLLVQETHCKVGCIPQRFVAVGTVAFPPINSREIWTVGFVHAVVNKSGRHEAIVKYYNQEFGKETL